MIYIVWRYESKWNAMSNRHGSPGAETGSQVVKPEAWGMGLCLARRQRVNIRPDK